MEWLNYLGRKEKVSKKEYRVLLLLLAPFSPHFSEELWFYFGEKSSIHLEKWPEFDEKLLTEEVATIVAQINGKVRDTLRIEGAKDKDQAEIEAIAKQSEKMQKYLEGKTVHKVIYVPTRAINFVVT